MTGLKFRSEVQNKGEMSIANDTYTDYGECEAEFLTPFCAQNNGSVASHTGQQAVVVRNL